MFCFNGYRTQRCTKLDCKSSSWCLSVAVFNQCSLHDCYSLIWTRLIIISNWFLTSKLWYILQITKFKNYYYYYVEHYNFILWLHFFMLCISLGSLQSIIFVNVGSRREFYISLNCLTKLKQSYNNVNCIKNYNFHLYIQIRKACMP